MIPNIFIVGVGRSGTSLLQSMVDSHSEIAFLPETQFVRRYILGGLKEFEFNREVQKNERLSRLSIDGLELTGISPTLALKRITGKAVADFGVSHIGMKDPRLLDYLQDLTKIYPGCKIIHVVRDPRDVTLSRLKAEWSKGRPFIFNPLVYEAQMMHYFIKTKNENHNLHIVKYEDLLAKPEAEISKIMRFVGLQYEKGQMEFQKSSERLVSENELQWKKETLGPLIRENTNKWRGSLNIRQVRIIETLCKRSMKAWGYQTSTSRTSFIERCGLNILNLAFFYCYKIKLCLERNLK